MISDGWRTIYYLYDCFQIAFCIFIRLIKNDMERRLDELRSNPNYNEFSRQEKQQEIEQYCVSLPKKRKIFFYSKEYVLNCIICSYFQDDQIKELNKLYAKVDDRRKVNISLYYWVKC